ncbi:hypothetical protein O1611_g2854 [Lasiodiplodia mahajangana]|uniref:Uncharacterized protein n=1 Tax=Lasiodiplodia mahajangana TaxID=1108764 RepID=A0ACC2JTC9_9PEZI|nr:hypothetical protein O1611_g2854 [Lasiodiplodia mahajangana]
MLRSSYSSHGSLGGGLPPVRPLHKPLRSVNENSVLLHSPGALESMLKTTTETGDIGVFTIKPVRPSPLRPRDTLPEFGRPHPKPRRSIDNLYRQNPSARPPSHRETTSEVFSVYGSDSLKSGTSTLTPNSTEDLGQRSYSITTCGSRHLSHHRSTNTLQSQASGGSHLQRPRSPFPYPTRLKRPGVRPASPAITESGEIDYSRMVEIDRISYRTVHGHFNCAYPPMSRRPHPLGLRADVNRSTPSLAPPGPPPNFHGPPRPPSIRTYSPSSMASWNTPYGGFEGTSARTFSLTSVTNMYRRMPPVLRTGQSFPVEPQPRYYDYTEDFENKPPRLASLTQAHLPQRIRYHHPVVIREDDDHLTPRHLAAVFGEGDSAFFDCESQVIDEQDVLPVLAAFPNQSQNHIEAPERPASPRRPGSALSQNSTVDLEVSEIGGRNARSSDIDLLPSQIGRDSIDTFNPSLDIESRDVPLPYNYATYHANATSKTKTTSPERHVQVLGGRALTIRSEQGVILRDDTNYETSGRETPESCQSRTQTGPHSSYSPSPHDQSPVVNDFEVQEPQENRASSVQDEPQYNKLSLDCVEGCAPKPELDSPSSRRAKSPSREEVAVKSGEIAEKGASHQIGNAEPEIRYNPQFRRHRRNHAVLRISTTNLPRGDNEGHPHITPTCSTVPLMSPKPISPARQLKVKNSIPKLMKALPPLPGPLGYDLPSTTTDVPEEDEFAEILVPFSFHGQGGPPQPNNFPPANFAPPTSEVVSSPQRDGPKFRLKIRTNGCSETSQPDENTAQLENISDARPNDELSEMNVVGRNQNKLKVRSPRRNRLSSSHCSTIRHNPNAEMTQIVTDLVRRKPQDLFSTPSRSDIMLLRKRRKPLSQLVYPQAATVFNASDPVPVEERVGSASYTAPSPTSTDNTELPTLNGGTLMSSIPPHGLIKRLSNLRLLLSSSATLPPQAPATSSLRIQKGNTNVLTSADSDIKNSLKTTESQMTEVSQRSLGQRIRARVSRWVKGAKTGMRRHSKRHKHEGQEGAEKT